MGKSERDAEGKRASKLTTDFQKPQVHPKITLIHSLTGVAATHCYICEHMCGSMFSLMYVTSPAGFLHYNPMPLIPFNTTTYQRGSLHLPS